MSVDDGKTYFSPEAEMLARENEQLRSRIADLQEILGLKSASYRLDALEKSVHQRFASVWDKIEALEKRTDGHFSSLWDKICEMEAPEELLNKGL